MDDKVKYWIETAEDDLITAKSLLEAKRYLHCGFFCHLITEKALKAVIQKNGTIPPKIHALLSLAEKGGVDVKMTGEQKALMQTLMPLQIEARYPSYKNAIAETLNNDICAKFLKETEDFLCWIKTLL